MKIKKDRIIKNYKEIIKALKSCPKDEDCRECDDFSECIHYLRSILVLVLLKFIKDIKKERNTEKDKGRDIYS